MGAYTIKHHGGQFSRAGVPDLLVSVNGYFVGIEVKSDTGKPSALQLEHIEQINNSGGIGFVLHPGEYDLFKSLVSKLLRNDVEDARFTAQKIMRVHNYV